MQRMKPDDEKVPGLYQGPDGKEYDVLVPTSRSEFPDTIALHEPVGQVVVSFDTEDQDENTVRATVVLDGIPAEWELVASLDADSVEPPAAVIAGDSYNKDATVVQVVAFIETTVQDMLDGNTDPVIGQRLLETIEEGEKAKGRKTIISALEEAHAKLDEARTTQAAPAVTQSVGD